MENVKQKIKYYLRIFLLAVLPSFLLFTFLTFPYGDLGNLVSSEVAKRTNNQVILGFKDMGFNFIPSPGLNFSNVEIRGSMLPELNMKELEISPSIAGLMSLKPGVRIASQGIFGGNLLLNTRGKEENAKGTLKHSINLEAQKISIKRLGQNFSLPVDLAGNIDIDLNSIVDPSFVDQPDGEVEINISPFKLIGGNINTGMIGVISLPPISLKRAVIKAQIKQNKLRINQFQIGSPNEDVMIKVKANLDLRFRSGPRGIRPTPGPYDAEIEINAGPGFERNYGVYLSFLEQYKKAGIGRNVYKFKVSGLSFRRPPKMQAL